MRLPRMTTRRWMVVVAVLALILAARTEVGRLLNLRQHHLAMAGLYGKWEMDYDRWRSRYLERMPSGAESSPRLRRTEQILSYCAQMREKYERAARYPWLPIEPDQPCIVNDIEP